MAKASRVAARQTRALEQVAKDLAELKASLKRVELKVDALSESDPEGK